MRRRTAAAAAALIWAGAAPARAQRAPAAQLRTTLEAGGASVRYGDTVRVTAATFTPSLRLDGGAVSATASGTLSSLGGGAWSTQGELGLSALSRARGPVRAELAGDAGGSTHRDGTRTGRYLGRARLHAGRGARGLWIGGAAGQTWDGSLWHAVVEGDAGAWTRVGGVTVVGALTPSAVGDSLRYTDAEAMVRWEGPSTDLAAGGGLRSGDALVRETDRAWGNVSVTLWLAPQIGVVASAGSYPVDFTQGFPGGRYVSLALRIAPQRTAPGERAADPPGSASPARARLEVTPLRDGRRVLRVLAPGARSVELVGDFTGWRRVALAPAPGGWWAVVMPLAAGTYQMSVRIDGGDWDVPDGVLETGDEFGARVGILIVR